MRDIQQELKNFEKKLFEAGFELNKKQIERFRRYSELLLQWNQRTNLISRKDEAHLFEKHFIESIAVLSCYKIPEQAHILDLGTGAGLPGVPLKIMRDDLNFVLVDSKRMKTLFLKEVVNQLGFALIDIVCNRVEALEVKYNAVFDGVVNRAVAPLNQLWAWSVSLLKSEGVLLAMKGGNLAEELVQFQSEYSNLEPQILSYSSQLIKIEGDKKLVMIQKLLG